MLFRLVTPKFTCFVWALSLVLFVHQAIAIESLTTQPQHNVAKVLFTNVLKPVDEYQAKDYLNTIDINESKNLYFASFLSEPLSDSLSDLMPDWPAEKVVSQGNYQFSFLVDKQLVYTENLNLGAGTTKQKSQDVVLFKPFYSVKNEDSWGRFLWMRFMHFGGEDALTEGQHQLSIEIRPYLKLAEIKTGKLLAKGDLTIKVTKPKVSEQQIAVQRIQANSGWTVSKQPFNQDKIKALNKRIAQNDFKRISSIVVIKEGELLIEEYFNGADRKSLHDPRSVGKSVASSMLGIAIEEGYIDSINQPLADFYDFKNFKNNSSTKTKVSLKDLVTMSSNFDGNDSDPQSLGNEDKMYPTNDWVKFALDLPMFEKAQRKDWRYFTAGVVVLGDVIHQSVPQGLEHYAHEKLFKPLGIETYQWQYTPQKVANTAGGLQLRALDFAKYGQLYKNKGVWHGKQILPKEWVDASLGKQVQRGASVAQGHYGYLFWNDDLVLNDKVYEVAYASGNGGNKIFIFKDIPYVIVITATAYNTQYAHKQVNQMMKNYILPAILEQ
ncbi:MAG: serine hydrolase [Paraglaciecola sp.]|uniref:serine hydrolase domain-containing protein n=1 Tax=Paraglaciecola sp. TaxID=1920173 RepID=UPI003297F308